MTETESLDISDIALAPRRAVGIITEVDWTQEITRAVARHLGITEEWNNENGRTKEQVIHALDREIAEADLTATFGPQWESIVTLIRRAAKLTEDEAYRLRGEKYRDKARTDNLKGARFSAGTAAGVFIRVPNQEAAMKATWNAIFNDDWDSNWDASRDTARDTAAALAIRDLIGDAFTSEHYRTLTGPWAKVIGPAHPDDIRDGLT